VKNERKSPKRLERKYEGPQVLDALLRESGCELTDEDVRAEFEAALEEGTPANEIVELLWEAEPRFASPEQARRTFSNLFGLYDAMANEAAAELVVLEEESPDPAQPLRASFVDRAWALLDELPRPELKRADDRFDNLQADVAAFLFETLSAAEVGEVALEVAEDLAFQTWWLLTHARGPESVARPSLRDLKKARTDELGEETEPALADFVSATLWEAAADEERPLPEADIPAVESALRTVRRLWTPRP
jgi:hypothetical protein